MSDVRILDDDALIGTELAALRDAATPPERFRDHARRIGRYLAAHVLHGAPGTHGTVTSPLGRAPSLTLQGPVVAVPILRAGLGLLAGFLDICPSALVGMIGMERDPETLAARTYYHKVPPTRGAWVVVLEPMLATGGSAAEALEALDLRDAANVVVASVTATRQAIERIQSAHPGVGIVAAALDDGLDANGYIQPGLGDFGDRLFGTTH